MQSLSLCSSHLLPFFGYRRVRPDGKGFVAGSPELYPTIEHFFQSEKFRGVDESYRRLLIDLPSASEVRKAAMHRASDIRPDWDKVKRRVMRAGIWMKCRQHHGFLDFLLTTEICNEYRYQDIYWGSARPGLSKGMYDKVLSYVRGRFSESPRIALITGSRTFTNQFLLHTKLDTFFRTGCPDEVICPCAPGADAFAEMWAIQNYVPVHHIPRNGGRSKNVRAAHVSALIADATHVVAFQQGVGGDVESVLTLARERKIPVRRVAVDASGTLIRRRAQR